MPYFISGRRSGQGNLGSTSADFTDSLSGPDLAFLNRARVPVGTASAQLSPTDARPGQQVWVAGYPEGNQLTITSGHVINYIPGSQLGVHGELMEISNHIEPGNSGSALVSSAGAVVGVVFAIRLSNHDGLAVPVSELSTFLHHPGGTRNMSCAD